MEYMIIWSLMVAMHPEIDGIIVDDIDIALHGSMFEVFVYIYISELLVLISRVMLKD